MNHYLENIQEILKTARREPDKINGRPHIVLPLEAETVIVDAATILADELAAERARADQWERRARSLAERGDKAQAFWESVKLPDESEAADEPV